MLLFAHTGIALGAGAVLAGIADKNKDKKNWFISLTKYVDVRVLMVGAMLPDIIDKPVGQFIFADYFHNGRIFSHTLLFLLLLSIIGFVLYTTKKQVWMLTLAAGTMMHLILDGMWGIPGTILWPLYGWGFPPIDLEGVVGNMFRAIVSDPVIFSSELIGLVIITWYWIFTIRRKQSWKMIKTGRVS